MTREPLLFLLVLENLSVKSILPHSGRAFLRLTKLCLPFVECFIFSGSNVPLHLPVPSLWASYFLFVYALSVNKAFQGSCVLGLAVCE